MPSTTDAAMPLFAAGNETLNTVSFHVAPSARLASSYSRGTALSAVSDTLMIEGRTMTVRTMIEEKRPTPSATLNTSRTKGTSTIMPTRP